MSYVFAVSGQSGPERAAALARLRGRWSAQVHYSEESSPGAALVFVVIRPARRGGARSGLGYAEEELRGGIVEAGGTLGDGTFVQITRTRPEQPSSGNRKRKK
jgi:hypothetical protein